MCSLDLEPCDVWEEEPRIMSRAHFKGRPHECDGCGSIIKRGDPYLAHSNLFEGKWSREKMCFACWWSLEVFAEAHGQRFAPSMLWGQLQDCIGENDDPLDEWRPHLAALKKRFRASAQGRRRAAREREERRRRRARTSWSLRAGDSPPFPWPSPEMRRAWFGEARS